MVMGRLEYELGTSSITMDDGLEGGAPERALECIFGTSDVMDIGLEGGDPERALECILAASDVMDVLLLETSRARDLVLTGEDFFKTRRPARGMVLDSTAGGTRRSSMDVLLAFTPLETSLPVDEGHPEAGWSMDSAVEGRDVVRHPDAACSMESAVESMNVGYPEAARSIKSAVESMNVGYPETLCSMDSARRQSAHCSSLHFHYKHYCGYIYRSDTAVDVLLFTTHGKLRLALEPRRLLTHVHPSHC